MRPSDCEYHQDQRDDAAGYGAVVLLALAIVCALIVGCVVAPLAVDAIDRFVGFLLCMMFAVTA